MRDAVLQRVSTRTFQNKDLSKKDIRKILNQIDSHKEMKGPYDHSFELTFSLTDTTESKGQKIGTYGVLKNPPAFIGEICENNFKTIIDFGYVFEHLILSLTQYDFGTCWLGGTFKRQHYRKNLNENEIIPAISPVGYKASNRRLIERIIRKAAQSQNRLSFSVLFKNYNDLTNLEYDLNNPIISALDLVRRGPSASNKQPWRAYLEDNTVHFYIERTPNYPGKAFKYDIQALDMGIALCHFEIGLKHFKKEISYFTAQNTMEIPNNEYVISVKISE